MKPFWRDTRFVGMPETGWQGFLRLIGCGPPDKDWPRFAHHLVYAIFRAGFLARDPTMSCRGDRYVAHFWNYRWQWRFWRGPYADCLAHIPTCASCSKKFPAFATDNHGGTT